MAGPGGSSAPCGGLRRNQAGALLRNAVTGALLSRCPGDPGGGFIIRNYYSCKCQWHVLVLDHLGGLTKTMQDYTQEYLVGLYEDDPPEVKHWKVYADPDGNEYIITTTMPYGGDIEIGPTYINANYFGGAGRVEVFVTNFQIIWENYQQVLWPT
jgi:hypothetical protein